MKHWIRSGFGICVAAVTAHAIGFQPLGFQSMGMGGAGVASASGSMAAYYNPALLAVHDYTTEITLSAGLGITEHNLADNLDTLNRNDLTGTIDRISEHAPFSKSNIASGDDKRMEESLNVIKKMAVEKSGLVLTPGAALGVQIKNFALGIYMTSDATAEPVIDPDHLELVVKNENSNIYAKYNPEDDTYETTDRDYYEAHSLEYAIDNGLTYLSLKGVSITEVPLSYGHAFETAYGTFGLGGSLKYMHGVTYATNVSIDTASGDISDSFDDKEKLSSAFGVDVGAFYTPNFLPKLRVAVVGKNLNTPEFDKRDGTTYKVDPMARAGIYYAGWHHWLDVALDVDLTSNKTFLDGVDSQYIGGGLNIHPVSWFSLRMGAMQNLADSSLGTIVTAGLGFGLKWLQVDVSAMVSTEKGHFDGNEIPRYARINLALLSRW